MILEAAAAGRPVIATDVGGVTEIFGPTAASPGSGGGQQGARPRDGLVISTARMRRIREAELRYAHIRDGFSVARMTDGIEALYRQALAARTGRRDFT